MKRKQLQMTDGKSRLDQMGRMIEKILSPVPPRLGCLKLGIFCSAALHLRF